MLSDDMSIEEGTKLILCYDGKPNKIVPVQSVSRSFIKADDIFFHPDGTPKHKDHFHDGKCSLSEITKETQLEMQRNNLAESISETSFDNLSMEQLQRISAIIYGD